MTDENSDKALAAVQKHMRSMLDKLERMEADQEDDLKNSSPKERERAQVALEQTRKLITEIRVSLQNLEAMIRRKEP